MADMAGSRGKSGELGHGISLILREIADLRADLAEDRKQAAEDRKQAAEDRKQFLEYCRRADEYFRRADDDRKETADILQGIRNALAVIGFEGKKFRVEQERQGCLLTEIRDALTGGRGGPTAAPGGA